MRKFLRRILSTAGLMLLGAVLGQLALHALIAGGSEPLSPWHRIAPTGELTAEGASAIAGLEGYLALEEALFTEAERRLQQEVDRFPEMSRFDPSSPTRPTRFSRNWNRTFELAAGAPRGGALLLHGLSDSPYSLRSIGEQLHAAGYYVLGLRLPGHGTIPGGLDAVAWEDWRAAVRLGVSAVSGRIGEEMPLVLVGYSNGSALALDYALDAVDDPALRRPERIVMLSPAIAVTPLAVLARYQRMLGLLPGLEKLRWTSVVPEFDPFKYNSFPIRAGSEIYRLTSTLEARLAALERSDRTGELPPMLLIQSIVDATVPVLLSLPRIVNRLDDTGSEVVLYDVNRLSASEAFLKPGVDALLHQENSGRPRGLSVTLVTNVAPDSAKVEARTREAREARWTVEPLDLSWPAGVYSLSHVAVPFPPDDPAYGIERQGLDPFPLGRLDARGEKGALIVSQTLFMRLRNNPFHDYQAARIGRFLELE